MAISIRGLRTMIDTGAEVELVLLRDGSSRSGRAGSIPFPAVPALPGTE